MYYTKCWQDRNDFTYDEIRQLDWFRTWYSELIDKGENDAHSEVRKYVQKHQLNLEQASSEMLKIWIHKYKEFRTQLEKYVETNDIRHFFEP